MILGVPLFQEPRMTQLRRGAHECGARQRLAARQLEDGSAVWGRTAGCGAHTWRGQEPPKKARGTWGFSQENGAIFARKMGSPG